MSKTVHNFSADMTVANTDALAARRKDPSKFLDDVTAAAPVVSGYRAPPAGPTPARLLGAQFVVPRPPGCVPGRFIPGCPNPHEGGIAKAEGAADDTRVHEASSSATGTDANTHGAGAGGAGGVGTGSTSSVGLVEQYMVPTEGACFAVVTLFFPAAVTDIMSPRPKMPLVAWYPSTAARPHTCDRVCTLLDLGSLPARTSHMRPRTVSWMQGRLACQREPHGSMVCACGGANQPSDTSADTLIRMSRFQVFARVVATDDIIYTSCSRYSSATADASAPPPAALAFTAEGFVAQGRALKPNE